MQQDRQMDSVSLIQRSHLIMDVSVRINETDSLRVSLEEGIVIGAYDPSKSIYHSSFWRGKNMLEPRSVPIDSL